ncbi:Hsp20 family protein [Noviherbaspirillum pedocola]|uniref:Hsp20 family protein n=1 Tax=Noviherbaspirillum pedocola TaxID=2801341 RepID=A0A934SV74_9BURK|nr:Hsp20 family protein [Noviherbaspirillum pedocola]MBK4736342.1 Hsp20 family protein [Noviherbaspirillum pedocola]
MATLEQTIDVNVPVHAAYNQWLRFEDYPRFMEGVREVQERDASHLHWRAERHEQEVEWDTEFIERIPDQLISWREIDGRHRGSLAFEPLRPNVTRLRMHMEFDAIPIDKEGAMTQRIAQDLARFRQMVEAQNGSDTAQEAQGDSAHARSESRSGAQAWLRSQFAGWEDPMALVKKMTEEMDGLFSRYIGRPIAARFGEGGVAGKWMPAVEITQRDDRLLICIDLPGIPRQDVQLLIQRDKVTVEGERREPPARPEVPGFRRSERSYGPFHRSIPLPEGVNADTAEAAMRDGVLEISFAMPDPSAVGGRRVDIG